MKFLLTQIIVGKALEFFINKVESYKTHTMPLKPHAILTWISAMLIPPIQNVMKSPRFASLLQQFPKP